MFGQRTTFFPQSGEVKSHTTVGSTDGINPLQSRKSNGPYGERKGAFAFFGERGNALVRSLVILGDFSEFLENSLQGF